MPVMACELIYVQLYKTYFMTAVIIYKHNYVKYS